MKTLLVVFTMLISVIGFGQDIDKLISSINKNSVDEINQYKKERDEETERIKIESDKRNKILCNQFLSEVPKFTSLNYKKKLNFCEKYKLIYFFEKHRMQYENEFYIGYLNWVVSEKLKSIKNKNYELGSDCFEMYLTINRLNEKWIKYLKD